MCQKGGFITNWAFWECQRTFSFLLFLIPKKCWTHRCFFSSTTRDREPRKHSWHPGKTLHSGHFLSQRWSTLSLSSFYQHNKWKMLIRVTQLDIMHTQWQGHVHIGAPVWSASATNKSGEFECGESFSKGHTPSLIISFGAYFANKLECKLHLFAFFPPKVFQMLKHLCLENLSLTHTHGG